MKRILCLISNMNAGGAETYLMKLYRNIDTEKYQMDFCINVYEQNYYEDEIISKGGYIYRIPSRSASILEHNKQLSSIIQDNGYDYVMAISSSATSFMDLKIAKKSGAKVTAIRSSNSNLGMSIIAKVLQAFFRILYIKYADILLSPSDLAAENMFGKRYQSNPKFHYLRNGLDLNYFSFKEEKRKSIRNEFNIGDSTIVVGHVGRFYEQKNHVFLLQVFTEMLKHNEDMVLMLVGNGKLESEIHEKASQFGILNKVIFAGVRNDVPDILSAMDLFIFPSLYEGMPNTVIEAQATGLNCLIANTITKEANVTGLVYYKSLKESSQSWASEALRLLKTRSKERNTSQIMIENKYDIQSCTEYFCTTVFGEK